MEGILGPDSGGKSDKGLLGLLGAYGSEDDEEDARATSQGRTEAESLPLTPIAEDVPNASSSPRNPTAAPDIIDVPEPTDPRDDSDMRDAETDKGLSKEADPFWLPPELAQPPDRKCAAEVQEKVREYIIKQEETGNTITSSLKSLSGYKNPDFLQHCVKYDNINQYGSCYPPEIFDPASLPAEDFYDRLAYEWEERLAARRNSQKAAGKTDFVSRGAEQMRSAPAGLQGPASAANMVAQAKALALNRSSKWDTRR